MVPKMVLINMDPKGVLIQRTRHLTVADGDGKFEPQPSTEPLRSGLHLLSGFL